MKSAPKHKKERERLEALKEYDILDTLPEQNFDDLTKLAATICDTDIALVSLVGDGRQWFKSRYGLDAEETERDIAFCSHAINQVSIFEVFDALKDERFHDNPLVTGDPNIRFYAGSQLYSDDGYPLGTLCVIDSKPKKLTDSQRNALQALARQVMSQLELRKSLMKTEALYKKLKEKNSELEKLEKHRTDFINHMSHEIRTPLNAILGFSRILSQENKREDFDNTVSQKEMIDALKSSAENLSEIVNHVLDLSRLEAGKMRKEENDFSIKNLVHDIIRMNSERAKEKALKLDYEVSTELPLIIKTDKTKLLQVLTNLIGNAIKFTPSGGEVDVKVRRKNELICFSVQDSGIGISSENLDKIFEPFQQIENSQAEYYVGSGLGLSICKQVVDFLGGSINVESQLNKGTCFELEIPLVVGDTNLSEVDTISEKLDLSDKTAFVVEDNKVNQLVLSAMLSKSNLRLEFVETIESALEKVSNIEPDIIFVDIRLPDGDGFSLIEQLQGFEKLVDVPIVILSGDVTKDSYMKANALGVVDFLEKPIDEKRLFFILEKSLVN
ncbi:hybrid sensor histidine kinase/response regulator [Pleionea sediminis]|uniref:hybrid sensor histidine kinase/response regulator n=1 Tax=Pleionea sediminis TaxID=2569479 RepID=UPI001184862E|nr:GAF domain-containing hybrid sensor histidine kinase/response regulator [Pleionea sediminis]